MGRLRPSLCAVLLLAGCGLSSVAPGAGGGRVSVVAAENFWGSIAAQLGGDRVRVTSVIVNPDTDPHAYEARPADARTMAQARYVIVNGVGYDPWAPKLLAANPVPGRAVLDVGQMLGKKGGDNPHLWYSPEYVRRVVNRITADLKTLDPAGASFYDLRNADYRTIGLHDYNGAIAAVQLRYALAPVGATESIFAYLAPALGLKLITPPGYMRSVSEGTDTSAADKATVQAQIAQRQLKLLVFNSQNTTPEVNAVVDSARAARIPVTSVTETMVPQGATFQAWQTAQLQALLRALGG